MVEQNNELLMKNHESQSTKTTSFSKVNVVFSNNHSRDQSRG